ncbi:MAG TPA: alpha-glucosidase [Candidatus Acidoferrales bacterium]|nr:alpha-glucosidase [Candidatus Acidoferrales bacterium]
MKQLASLVLIFAGVCLFAGEAAAQEKKLDAKGHEWWQHAVFYEIYPRSFADSNNDGVGDLNGIASRLDYLKALGIDAIWITPCFPSPQVDFGYDVSDYEAIDPMYGTLADFDKLVKEGQEHGIRVILDFVVNHTSDQHPWFVDSRSSRTAEHRDWYIWRDGKGAGQPPNNWLSTFGSPAWTLDPKTNQYYYHYFYPQQPDLNWRNPAVERAMLDVERFWYKRGAAGFRLDAVDSLFEDPNLTDDPVRPGKDKFGRPNLDERYNKKLPEVHDVMRKLRSVSNEYGAVLIGETWTSNVAELKDYYGSHNDELQMPMDLMLTTFRELSAAKYRAHIGAVDAAGGWPVYVISNHDIVRSYTRYGDGQHNDQIAKLLAAMYLTLRGTPILYYGEEIGMENNNPKRKEDVQDPIGKIGWPKEIGRDGERTPMQWTSGKNAGFSEAKPWLPVPASHAAHNVMSETQDANSVLNFYKKLLAMRHREAALLEGQYIALDEQNPDVYSFLRKEGEEAILVVLNMSRTEQKVSFDFAGQGFPAGKARTMLTDTNLPQEVSTKELTVAPLSAYIGKLER